MCLKYRKNELMRFSNIYIVYYTSLHELTWELMEYSEKGAIEYKITVVFYHSVNRLVCSSFRNHTNANLIALD